MSSLSPHSSPYTTPGHSLPRTRVPEPMSSRNGRLHDHTGISMGVHAGSLHHTAISGLYSRGGIVDFNDIGSEEDDFTSAELERNLHL
ncbi:unnamed protein product [Ixodes hexagonus]